MDLLREENLALEADKAAALAEIEVLKVAHEAGSTVHNLIGDESQE